MIEAKCTNCIHCDIAFYRDDKMCVPQQFSAAEPRSIESNRPCKYYEEAPRYRDRYGLYGIESLELWNEEEGHYYEERGFII